MIFQVDGDLQLATSSGADLQLATRLSYCMKDCVVVVVVENAGGDLRAEFELVNQRVVG